MNKIVFMSTPALVVLAGCASTGYQSVTGNYELDRAVAQGHSQALATQRLLGDSFCPKGTVERNKLTAVARTLNLDYDYNSRRNQGRSSLFGNGRRRQDIEVETAGKLRVDCVPEQ